MLPIEPTLPFSDHSSLYDILVPKTNLLRQINDLIDFSFIRSELLTKYSQDNGRTAECPIRMFKYLLLKIIYDLSDVDVVEHSLYDLSYKYFLGMVPEETSLINPSSLSKFRKLRLKDNDLMDLLIKKTVNIAVEKGIIKSRTIIVDSTVTCRMKRSDVIDNANIRPGDVIVGLASYGQATYEKEYNGGMGSNGLTSARHDVFAKYLAEKYPESFDKAVPEDLVYSGGLKLTDAVEGSPLDAGKLVLSPTRTYAPVVKKLLDALRPQIHGMVHCSGGAQTKILHFVGDNIRVIKDNLFPVPPLFKTIHEQSGTDWAEMYKVFNMGHRLEVYLSPEHAEEVIAISKSFGIDAQIVGRVEECDHKELIIRSEFGEFIY